MYASPAQTQIRQPESPDAAVLPVASQPTRMAFVAYSDDSRIKAFWKQPEESGYRFTIEIDPLSNDSGEVVIEDAIPVQEDSAAEADPRQSGDPAESDTREDTDSL
jgi:hypothetical protein